MRVLRFLFLGLAVLLALAVLFIVTADLGRFHSAAESLVSSALGRSFAIDGNLSIHAGRHIEVVAEEITLADAEWRGDDALARVARITLVLDTASLLSPTVRIVSLRVEEPQVHLATNADGIGNWVLPQRDSEDSTALESLPVRIDDGVVTSLLITYATPEREQPLEIRGERISLRGTGGEALVLDAKGAVNATPFTVRASAATADTVVALADAEVELAGSLGEVAFDGNLAIASLRNPSKPVARLRAQGPSAEYLTDVLGLRQVTTGPLDVNATVLPEGESMAVRLNGAFGEFGFTAEGRFDRLDSLQQVDASFSANGPDASRVGAVLGIRTWPTEPFDVGGEIIRRGGELSVESVRVNVGSSELTLDADFSDFPDPGSGRAELNVRGPQFGHFNRLLGLPGKLTGPFSANGTLVPAEGGGALIHFAASAADLQLTADGRATAADGFAGSTLVVKATGPDLRTIARAAGLSAAPAHPFEATMRLKRANGATAVDAFELNVAQIRLSASGTVSDRPLSDSVVDFDLSGSDLAGTLVAFGRDAHNLPSTSFEASGGLRLEDGALLFEEVDARVGDNGEYTLSVNGRVAKPPRYTGSHLRVRSTGDRLAVLAKTAGIAGLPDAPFELTGDLKYDGRRLVLRTVEASVAGATLTATGHLGSLPGLDGTRTELTVIGGNLAALAPGIERLAPFDQPFRITAVASVKSQRLTVNELQASYDGLQVDGEIATGLAPLAKQGRFDMRVASPDIIRLLATATGKAYSDNARLDVNTRGDWQDNSWAIDALSMQLGNSTLKVSGTLDGPPGFDRTDLQARLDIPDLSLYEPLAGRPLPPESASVEFAMRGTASSVILQPLRATVGSSDLDGMASYTSGEVPRVELTIRSRRLNLAPYLPETAAAEAAQEPAKPASRAERLIPDTPIAIEKAAGIEVLAQLDIGELVLNHNVFSNVGVQATVRDGVVDLARLQFTSDRNEQFEARATLSPSPNGAALLLQADGTELAVGLPAANPEEFNALPRYDIQTVLRGSGATVRQLAASLDGYVRLVAGPGRLRAGAGRLFTNDFFSTLLNAVNPFAKSQPFVNYQCAVGLVTINDGMIEGKPAAILLSDRLKIIANAGINLSTEDIDISVNTVPQKGLGISVTDLVNPYLKIGGTLASPNLEVDPQSAVIEGGAAVATAGLSFLAKRFYQRYLSSKDPCGQAVSDADPVFAATRARILGVSAEHDAAVVPAIEE